MCAISVHAPVHAHECNIINENPEIMFCTNSQVDKQLFPRNTFDAEILYSTVIKHIYLFILSGLVKAKKYDWKDSNMALVGSDTDRSVKSKWLL